jgi:hypothetical protein
MMHHAAPMAAGLRFARSLSPPPTVETFNHSMKASQKKKSEEK